MRRVVAGIATVGLVGPAGCSGAALTPDPDAGGPVVVTAAGAIPRPDHVLVAIFENRGQSSVIGSSKAPYLTSLAESGANFTDAHGEAHPSQPNYLALFSGSTNGITDNTCPPPLTGENLATQLLAAGHTFTGYSEDLPAAGFTGCTAGAYARKHNPWVDFTNVSPAANQPLTAMPSEYAALPTVAMVVPNLCNDMHDCPVATGDDWARRTLAPYVSWASTHNSMLIVTFDEDEGTSDNRIPTVVVGPMVRAGDTDQQIDHYNLLRTIEEMYGLPPLGHAATAAPLSGIWQTGG